MIGHQDMCVAYGGSKTTPMQLVMLHGQIFMANRGLIELMVEKMKEKHPDATFSIEVVQGM